MIKERGCDESISLRAVCRWMAISQSKLRRQLQVQMARYDGNGEGQDEYAPSQ